MNEFLVYIVEKYKIIIHKKLRDNYKLYKRID